VFALLGKDAEQQCIGHCKDSEIAEIRRDYLIADVSWIVGAAAFAGATIAVLAGRSSGDKTAFDPRLRF
jgi:hypothetical protein